MKNDILPYLLLLAMTLLGSMGSVLFKAYSIQKKLAVLLLGFGSYGLGALLNIYLLKELPYTIVMPANALTFLWAMLFARLFFKESIGTTKIAGAAFIISGLLLLVW